eukprot:CAMPEP_0176088984 /NCGR_PEP_ID=MMETSP0120_2-20121206/44562_1 /TAXON_ID=160619 /ORGANISM="Kryptoperidinium foliaceum, Strain CCMP 1326" /LENGTH=296 /DNA_ID=CAMNT_0017422857 /DNA_START=131 /DNA_END=1017 /DNA_ORIENTATION=-
MELPSMLPVIVSNCVAGGECCTPNSSLDPDRCATAMQLAVREHRAAHEVQGQRQLQLREARLRPGKQRLQQHCLASKLRADRHRGAACNCRRATRAVVVGGQQAEFRRRSRHGLVAPRRGFGVRASNGVAEAVDGGMRAGADGSANWDEKRCATREMEAMSPDNRNKLQWSEPSGGSHPSSVEEMMSASRPGSSRSSCSSAASSANNLSPMVPPGTTKRISCGQPSGNVCTASNNKLSATSLASRLPRISTIRHAPPVLATCTEAPLSERMEVTARPPRPTIHAATDVLTSNRTEE